MLFVYSNSLNAQELFSRDKIVQYLTKENPYVYSAIGNELIYKEKYRYSLGEFDTKVSAKYDKKEYPVSKGEFVNVGLHKPIENGMEFSLDYRRAEGTQEYNNIKTSEDGEMLLGVKIPVFSVVNDTSKRKLNLNSASLDSAKYSYKSKDNLRKLYFEVIKIYNELLYYKEVLKIENELLNRAKEREHIVTRQVQNGALADIALVEVQQQIINREQRVISTRNFYSLSFENFLKYLNLSSNNFNIMYTLPSMPEIENEYLNAQQILTQALEQRPDLKTYDYEIKKINLQEKQTNVMKYPKFNVSLYGVHDFKYDNGFKVALDMDFPIERRKYEASYAKNRKSIKNIQSMKQKQIINIKTNIINIIYSLNNVYKNINNSIAEIVLVKKLETAEHKKYKLGMSNLFMLNQREVYTLQIKKKLLHYKLEFLLLQEKLKKEMGEFLVI